MGWAAAAGARGEALRPPGGASPWGAPLCLLTSSSTSWSSHCVPPACHISAFKWNLLEIFQGTKTHVKTQSFHVIFFSIIYFSAT